MQTDHNKHPFEEAAQIVKYAGGKIVGRTRLQKIACLLNLAGYRSSFTFDYYHYGPYSEELASAISDASILGLINEEEKPANWGGTYSIYTVENEEKSAADQGWEALAELAASADPIELELAVTAAFLQSEGVNDPWEETKSRKPEKAKDGRLEKAKNLYAQFCAIQVPTRLPHI